jgi:formiminotetrahydrofolate cyclodeaminase
MGAHLNVKINAKSLADKSVAGAYLSRAGELEAKVKASEGRILEVVNGKVS